jgi:hypothetical protein
MTTSVTDYYIIPDIDVVIKSKLGKPDHISTLKHYNHAVSPLLLILKLQNSETLGSCAVRAIIAFNKLAQFFTMGLDL